LPQRLGNGAIDILCSKYLLRAGAVDIKDGT
jgi:hypothetical protein